VLRLLIRLGLLCASVVLALALVEGVARYRDGDLLLFEIGSRKDRNRLARFARGLGRSCRGYDDGFNTKGNSYAADL